jgi:hypothetical protein
MTRKRAKQLKKQMRGKGPVVEEHLQKINEELAKPSPNYDRIRHWEAEIRNTVRQIKKGAEKLRFKRSRRKRK